MEEEIVLLCEVSTEVDIQGANRRHQFSLIRSLHRGFRTSIIVDDARQFVEEGVGPVMVVTEEFDREYHGSAMEARPRECIGKVATHREQHGFLGGKMRLHVSTEACEGSVELR